MELNEIMVSCFPNVLVKVNPKHIPLLEVLESIRKGDLRVRVERVRKETDHNLRNDLMLKTVDIRSPKTGISVHYSYSLLMAMQIY